MKDVTYRQFVSLVRPKKAEPNQMQFTVATLTAEMLGAKMLFNSVISMKGAGFMTMDISNFYLCCKPLINVPYIHTFGAPDQGQMLDV
jgi:hypothetical protein